MSSMFRFLRLLPVTAAVLVGLSWAFAAAAAGAPALWRWPLADQPTVVRGFDPPPVPWAAGHRGVDLRARAGDVVVAAGSGVVGFAGMLAGRGVVAVHHAGGLETTYEPLRVLVRTGQRVVLGQVLGRVTAGHGGCGIGFVCLHWGLRRGGTYLDPLSLVRAGPIRLLPVWSSGPGWSARLVQPAVNRSHHDRAPRASRGPLVAGAGVAAMGAVGAVAVAASRRGGRATPT